MKLATFLTSPHTDEQTRTYFRALATFAALALLFIADPAYAQLEAATTFMQKVTSLLRSLGGVIVTIAIMWTGYKMIFKGAAFSDVAQIFIGAMLIGSAALLAGYLIPA